MKRTAQLKRSGFRKPTADDARLRTGRETGKVKRTCRACNKEFEAHRCRVAIACSVVCARALRRTKVERVCLTCGNGFLFAPSQVKRYRGAGKYCSRKCSYQGTIAKHADKPAKDKYGRTGRAADREWQKAVRERDECICQRCGIYDPHIHTHHVSPRALRPDLKHDVDNGKCLCAHCHLWCHHHPIEARALCLLSNEPYERAKQPKSYCSLCGERAAGRGYCRKHYKRLLKYGDPLLTKAHGPSSGELVRVAPEVSMR